MEKPIVTTEIPTASIRAEYSARWPSSVPTEEQIYNLLHVIEVLTPVSANGTEPRKDLSFQFDEELNAKLDKALADPHTGIRAASHNGQGWVKVDVKPTDEQIAEHKGWFQVANEKTKRQDIAKYLKGDFMGHALQFNDVTHWQPLPAPPSEANGPQTKENK